VNEEKPVDFYLNFINQISPDFLDDGLSCFPDWIYRYLLKHNVSPAGRVHDWHYCSRCHPSGTMDQTRRKQADRLLRLHVRELTHGHFRLTPWVVWLAVRRYGVNRAWNSCGPNRCARCRHNMRMPEWMEA
jgi:hypothetical protein